MAKKFSIPVIKCKKVCFIISSLLFVASLVGIFVFGFNLGIDFDSGITQTVQVAPSGMKLSFKANKSAVLSANSEGFSLELRDAEGVTKNFYGFSEYPTVGALASELQKVEGLKAEVFDASLLTANAVTGFGFPATLTSSGFIVNFESDDELVSISQMREALSQIKGVKVQTVGSSKDQVYQIRVKLENEEQTKVTEAAIKEGLAKSFGENTAVILENNFIGAKFSSSLLSNSLLAVAVAVALILIYVWIRFELGYAISSVVALVHDVVLMLGFVFVMKFEVSSTTIAAVLTIIGYSLNNTIVIFDRVREKVKIQLSDTEHEKLTLAQMVDLSVSESLSRTTISSVTTLLAVIPLCIFSTGDINYFAWSLLFGIVVGTYSSNFIAPALLYQLSSIKGLDPTVLREKKSLSDEDSASYLLDEDFKKAQKVQKLKMEEQKAQKLELQQKRVEQKKAAKLKIIENEDK